MEAIKRNILIGKSARLCLSAAVQFCEQNDKAMACWKLPQSDEVKLLVDFGTPDKSINLPLEERKPGFIINPFHHGHPKIYLNKDLLISWGDTVTVETWDNTAADSFLSHMEHFEVPNEEKSRFCEVEDKAAAGDYKQLVLKSTDHIRKRCFHKVVPARFKQFEGNFSTTAAATFFHKLTDSYPDAFVFLIYTADTGLWAGATPELLIRTSGRLFNTVALAGTQLFDPGKSLAQVAWTQKEIEEQAIVSRYIINCFKKIRLREFDEHGPKTVRAGNLIHLKTDFRVDMQEVNFPELGSVMLQLLHPTSAVCGMPLQPAFEFLLKNEGFDRELFSGFLGPVNIGSETTIFVNLRCMKVEDGLITLYAGAGVTEDSDPEKEWLETEMKMNTVFNAIADR